MPAMGVRGAALGTVFARTVEFAVITITFFVLDKQINYKLKNIKDKCCEILREHICISTPVLISDALLALELNVAAIVTGLIGSSFVSVIAITSVAQLLSTVFIHGVCVVGSIITGQILGE